jgi:alpha-D-ribose 1-methylphosphonate 5-triphosphate diphosphatase PhnM
MNSLSQTVYCIDTSALVDMRIVYPLRNFTSVWEKFGKLVEEGKLISPNEVSREIEKRDDDLRKWTRQHKPKILDVCAEYGIKCIRAENLIEREGWKF